MRLVAPIVAASLAFALATFAQTARPTGGWTAAARNGCKVWNVAPQPLEAVSWSGACVKGLAEGPGRIQWYVNGQATDSYDGDMRTGRMEGKGTYNWSNGDRYIGDYRANDRHGHGLLVFHNGDRYEGEFHDGRQEGQGVYVWRGGDRYEGSFVDGLPQGKGALTFASGGTFDGEWQNGLPNGPGTHRTVSGQTFAGNWANGCFTEGTRRDVVLVTRKQCGF